MGDGERWWSSPHPAHAGRRSASWLLKLEGDEVSLGSRDRWRAGALARGWMSARRRDQKRGRDGRGGAFKKRSREWAQRSEYGNGWRNCSEKGSVLSMCHWK